MKYLLILAFVVIAYVNVLQSDDIEALEGDQTRISRVFEDGSGRLEFSNGTCIIPAFDNPEDRLVCTKESQ